MSLRSACVTFEGLNGDELLGVRVLVVDDEPETLDLVCLTLRSVGAEVFEASSAEVALAKLDIHTLDVVISDLQMPGLDGYDLMRLVRERPSRPVGIALSASSSMTETARALDAGFTVHVAKPIAMVDLVDTIRAALPVG